MLKKNQSVGSLFSSRDHHQAVQVLDGGAEAHSQTDPMLSENSYCVFTVHTEKIPVLESGGTTKKQSLNNRSKF